MIRPSLIALALVSTLAVGPARSQEHRPGWLAGLGLPPGDLRGGTDRRSCLGQGGHLEGPPGPHSRLRARLDGLGLRVTNRASSGNDGLPGTRSLDRIHGWALGAEYLVTDLAFAPWLRFGAGLHGVRWRVDSPGSLAAMPGDRSSRTLVEAHAPGWTRLAWSAVADVRITGRIRAEARLFRSPFSWEGEQVNLLQFGLRWSF